MSPAENWPLPADTRSAARLLIGEAELLDHPLSISANGVTLLIAIGIAGYAQRRKGASSS